MCMRMRELALCPAPSPHSAHLHACDEAAPDVRLDVCQEAVAAAVQDHLVQDFVRLLWGRLARTYDSAVQPHAQRNHDTQTVTAGHINGFH